MNSIRQHKLFLNDLKIAFSQVPERLYSWWAAKEFKNMEESGETLQVLQKKYKQQIERVFAYELYHLFRCIMKEKEDEYENMHLHGEIFKGHIRDLSKFQLYDYGFTGITTAKDGYIPDLTLHAGNDSKGVEQQALVVEIKSDMTPNAIADIVKLLNLVNNYDFSYGVFITINCPTQSILESIKAAYKGSIKDEDQAVLNLFSQIKIMSRQSVKETITEVTLMEILKQ